MLAFASICSFLRFYTRQNFHEKLSTIIDEFPHLDGIQPFYGDLLHVLYNKDRYKLALGQINTVRSLISKIAKDLSSCWSMVILCIWPSL